MAIQGENIGRARKRGGIATALATQEEKAMIANARDSLAKEHEQTKKWAAKKIAAQLRTGTFRGIDRTVDYDDDYVARLRVQR